MGSGNAPDPNIYGSISKHSGFTGEFFTAFGTCDGNFSLTPGNPDNLPTFGTVEIAMIPVFQPVEKLQKLAVFLIALVGLPRQAAVNCPEHQKIGHRSHNQIYLRTFEECPDQASRQTGTQNHHIQPVCSIASSHKSTKAVG